MPTIGATIKAKYDEEWFIGELVAYNKEIDEWTIYFKEDDYIDYVISWWWHYDSVENDSVVM